MGKAPDHSKSGPATYLAVLEIDGKLNSEIDEPHSRTDAAARMN